MCEIVTQTVDLNCIKLVPLPNEVLTVFRDWMTRTVSEWLNFCTTRQ